MKKTVSVLGLVIILFFSSSSFIYKHSSGEAGKTGSPGEQTCAGGGCHSGGNPSSFGVSISSTPAFTLNQFVPGTVYTISIDVAAAAFPRFGFGCEILNSLNANAGTMQSAGPGVKFLNFGARKNATHTTPKISANNANFSFEWVAPLTDTSATIYVCGNAVNGNNSTSGDKPIPASLYLTAFKDTTTHVSIHEVKNNVLGEVNIFPNPANEILSVSLTLKQNSAIEFVLFDLNGKSIKNFGQKEMPAGTFTKILNIDDLSSGVYFLRINEGQIKLAQKLVVIQ